MTGANTDASPACRSPYVVDRIKPLVIRGGGSIDCGTVKAALLDDPDIIEAARLTVRPTADEHQPF